VFGDEEHKSIEKYLDFQKGSSKAGREDLRPGEWVVYPEYLVKVTEGGHDYIHAPETVKQLRGRQRYRPLAHSNAGLFLEFAGWPDKWNMSRKDPESNEDAAIAWAQKYGVLGVDDPKMTLLGDSSLAIDGYLGRPGPDGFIGRGMLNEAFGGRKETIVRFTDEALEARFVWQLYDAATAQPGGDTRRILNLMAQERDDFQHRSIREIYGQSPEAARDWALRVVQETITRKVAGRCYPTLHGGPGSYDQGWSFDSLLGAMWLQMLWLMTGQTRRCLWCNMMLASEDRVRGKRRRTRSDKQFCSDSHKAKWNYEYGIGKSSKHARKHAREKAK